MRNAVKKVNFFHLICLLVLLASFAVVAVYTLSYLQASFSPVKTKVTETIHSEDIVLVLSSSKQSYVPGETADFNIDILNNRDFPISKLNFSLTVRAVSLFDLNVFSMEGSSSRTFAPGKFERLRTFPKDVVEVHLPQLIPPGYYNLELSARSPNSTIPTKASIVIHVEPSIPVVSVAVITMMLSGAFFVLLVAGANVNLDRLPKTPLFRIMALTAYSANSKSNDVSSAFSKTYRNLSIGQKFVLLAVVVLAVTPLPIILEFENLANDFAVLAYLSLAIGVPNLLWESLRHGSTGLKTPLRIRPIANLLTLGLLMYFSNKLLAAVISCLGLYLVGRSLVTYAMTIHKH